MKTPKFRTFLQIVVFNTVCASVSPANADEQLIAAGGGPSYVESISIRIPDGSYQAFNPWQKFRLGATALVNPSTARQARIVFSYPASVVFVDEPSDMIVQNIESGMMSVGYFEDPGYGSHVVVDETVTKEVLEILRMIKGQVVAADLRKGNSEPVFLTSSKGIVRSSAAAKLISWEPSSKLTTYETSLSPN